VKALIQAKANVNNQLNDGKIALSLDKSIQLIIEKI
jgi:hypothetical protein